MPHDLQQWLEALHLGKYLHLLVENDVDLAVLPHITEAELEGIGLPLGARRRIQLALQTAADEPGQPAAAEDETAPAEAERRHVTVMFCDLVGSTALSATLDAEAYRELLREYQDACAGEITRHHGHVAQFLGDGVLAYFGWPRAREDDVALAIHAALGVIRTVSGVPPPRGQADSLAVRIGLATGPVVIGDLIGTGSAQQAAVTGETPNRAARVQHIAGANESAIDEATRALAGGRFECESLGTHALKGLKDACEVWRVNAALRTESRFAAVHGERLTPLVGRAEELELMTRRWRRACTGDGSVVLVAGEPGIGKSRLTQALQEAIGGEPHVRLLLQCSPRHVNSALHPVVHAIEFDAELCDGDASEVQLSKLEGLLQRAGEPASETVALFAALLAIDQDRHALPALTPQRQKERTLAALVNHVAALSKRTPVLLVFEDVHWIDPTSLELLNLVVERIRDLQVLTVITFRPEFSAPWIGQDHVSLLTLNRLGPGDRVRMAAGLTDAHAREIVAEIAERSDGIPLFIEELARSTCESRAGLESIPASLHDALEARFDRSPATREVAQVGAVIGREFGGALVAHVASLTGAELDAALAALVDSGLLLAHGTPPHVHYRFKHALIQDTAYGTLLRTRRGALHARIAEALMGSLAAGQSATPEVIAHHFTAAEDAERAIPFWQRRLSACLSACRPATGARPCRGRAAAAAAGARPTSKPASSRPRGARTRASARSGRR